MGNPSIHLDAPGEPPPPSSNGVLSWVGGDSIALGGQQLPKAGPEHADKPRREVDLVGVERFGVVRITYELASYRHRRSRYWSWRAVRADPLLLELPVRQVRWLVDWRAGPGWRREVGVG